MKRFLKAAGFCMWVGAMALSSGCPDPSNTKPGLMLCASVTIDGSPAASRTGTFDVVITSSVSDSSRALSPYPAQLDANGVACVTVPTSDLGVDAEIGGVCGFNIDSTRTKLMLSGQEYQPDQVARGGECQSNDDRVPRASVTAYFKIKTGAAAPEVSRLLDKPRAPASIRGGGNAAAEGLPASR